MRALQATVLDAPSPLHSAMYPPSPRHSPVPYLFGGLAAMLGLIAFALLILACSYWKLSGYIENSVAAEDNDASAGGSGGGEKPGSGVTKAELAASNGELLVIMAGQVNPTFLATPSTSRSSSFGDDTANGKGSGRRKENGEKGVSEQSGTAEGGGEEEPADDERRGEPGEGSDVAREQVRT